MHKYCVISLLAALNKTMRKLKKTGRSLEEFSYEDKEIADLIYKSMNTTQFLGISVSYSVTAMHHLHEMFDCSIHYGVLNRREQWRSVQRVTVSPGPKSNK